MELVFSYLFEDKPLNYRSWNSICVKQNVFSISLSITLLQLPCERCPRGQHRLYRLLLRSPFSVVALCMCALSGEKPSQKKLSSGYFP